MFRKRSAHVCTDGTAATAAKNAFGNSVFGVSNEFVCLFGLFVCVFCRLLVGGLRRVWIVGRGTGVFERWRMGAPTHE